jgi:CBS-domain-containing membrane protein
MHILDRRLKEAWRSYVFQCLLAVLALIAILYFLDILTHAAIVAALGASSFIIFAMPKSLTAQPRNVIGGHIMGLLAGSICYFALLYPPLGLSEKFLYICAAALSVGLSILLMVITDTEHPPASATALGIVAYGWSLWTTAFVILFAVALSLVKYLLGRWLRELV